MATITVKKIPDDLYDRLRDAARLNHRSINSEIIVCLEVALKSRRLSSEEILSRARDLRSRTRGGPFTVQELIDAAESDRR